MRADAPAAPPITPQTTPPTTPASAVPSPGGVAGGLDPDGVSTAAEPRSRPAVPYQQPAPLPDPTPATEVLPPGGDQARPLAAVPDRSWAPAPTPRQPSRVQQTLQLLALGALTAGVVAWAPYAGLALVGLVVLALRTVSVARQRHGRRRLLRGRARWYDVPTTTLSTPGYLLLALAGTLMLVGSAAFTGLAMFSLGYLLQQPVTVGLVMAGLGVAPVLWWGPGSARVREIVRGTVVRTSRSEFGGWFVVAMALLGAAVMVALLASGGPNWAPAASAPWR